MTDERLDPVDEDWTSALAIVAHPDDLEYGMAAAVARWTAQGKRVVYCLLTSGEAGIDGLPPDQAGPLREDEQRAAAGHVGVDVVEFLGYPDGVLEYGLPMRRDVARAVRRHRPDVVLTTNIHEWWAPGRPNQADHIAVARAVLDGARDAGNRWVFPELVDEGLPPWPVRLILSGNPPEPTHAVDVSDALDQGVASLEAHVEYLRGLGPGAMPDAREWLESLTRPVGARLGCRFAVGVEVIHI